MPGCFSYVCIVYWGRNATVSILQNFSPGGWHEGRQVKRWEQVDQKCSRVSILEDTQV